MSVTDSSNRSGVGPIGVAQHHHHHHRHNISISPDSVLLTSSSGMSGVTVTSGGGGDINTTSTTSWGPTSPGQLSVSSLSPPPFAITNGHTTLVHNGLSPSSSYDSLSPRGECPPFSLTHIPFRLRESNLYIHSAHNMRHSRRNETATKIPVAFKLREERAERGSAREREHDLNHR